MTRRVVILGSTGSIGRQALDVVRAHGDRFAVTGLAAARDAAAIIAQIDEFGVAQVALDDPAAAQQVREARPHVEVLDGDRGVCALAAWDTDLVVNGVAGAAGLASTLASLHAGTPVALANKESLIVGGALVTRAAAAVSSGKPMLIPVDSEHSAIAQCLRGGNDTEVARLVLTASGGPFRGRHRDELAAVTPDDALAHPTWDMGPLVSVNSATMMNKGLELIEAHELFGISFDALEVVVHPQSIVHSMVEFVDGSTLAQLSPPDMRLPIQLAMAWPERLGWAPARCDWATAHSLTFEPADRETFSALDLAVSAGRRGGTYPAVLNAGNEVAVAAFLDGAIGFLDIVGVVEDVLDTWDASRPREPRDIDDVLDADRWARRAATTTLTRGRREVGR
ncbi:MAG: 1-deoxy-D-xylulose-5-phosphate reductoisomerase [Nitriliruptoraceae bacterium]